MVSVANKLTVFLVLLAGVQLHLAAANAENAFPTVHVDASTIRIQDKATKLFEKGQYDRAYFIFRNELAPLGDKYSQYMVGFMYLTGKSVERDRARAAAWYRLAAERGLPEFVAAYDELLAALNVEERARADRWFTALRTEVGDLAVLMSGVRSDYERLQARENARLARDNGLLFRNQIKASGGIPSMEQSRRIERRMNKRLKYIIQETGLDIDVDSGEVDIDLIEDAVYTHLRAGD